MTAAPIVEVDLGGVTRKEEIHDRFAAALGFPSYYGKNWDAFWDCVTTLDPMPQRIRIKGVSALAGMLPGEVDHLKRCFDDFRSEPDLQGVTVDIT